MKILQVFNIEDFHKLDPRNLPQSMGKITKNFDEAYLTKLPMKGFYIISLSIFLLNFILFFRKFIIVDRLWKYHFLFAIDL